MTVRKAARLYEVPYRTLHRLVKQGRIKTIPHPLNPRQVLIDPEEEDKLLQLANFYSIRRRWWHK